jgi:iron complex transport system substrate-binding protein
MRVLFLFFFIFLIFGNAFAFERIVSLSPALTEMVVYTGAEGKLVGVTDFCTLNVRAERVGGIVNPNVEKIISLKPDLILATNMTPLGIRRVLSRVAKVVVFHLVSLKEVEDAVESVGNLVGSDGKELRERFEKELGSSLKTVSCLEGKRVIVLVSCSPIYVAGGESYIGQALSLAGLRIVPENVSFGAVSAEFVVQNGEIAVLSCHSGGGDLKLLLRKFGLKVYEVPGSFLLHPSPMFLRGVKYLGEEACGLR